jgi:O-antigen/teichoic acid export membrane protein
MLEKYLKSEFIKNAFTLIKGSLLAQGISIGLSFVLTRLYTPEDFGLFALYASIVGVLAVIATGRYEMAIVLPQKEEDAKALVQSSLLIAFGFSFLVLIFVFLFGDIFAEKLGNPSIRPWLYLVPISILVNSLYNVYNYWCTRSKKYKQLSHSRIIHSTSGGSINLIGGLLNVGPAGLIFGQFFGFIFSGIYLKMKSFSSFKTIETSALKPLLKEYKDFPLKSGLSGLLNILANQLPVILVGVYFGPVVLGFYALILKVLNLPLTMVGKSVSQVFFQAASDAENKNEDTSALVRSTSIKLFLLILVPMAILMCFGQELFSFAFGEEWAEAGRLAKYFAVFYISRFVFYSQSTLFVVKRKLGIELIQNAMLLITQVGSIIVGNIYFTDYVDTFVLMAISGFVMYTIFLFSLFRISKK